MQVRPLAIPGAYEVTPRRHRDERGSFLEWYREDALVAAVGHPLRLAQANCSVSRHGVIRGLHVAQVPPGQAKYVTCVRGAILDVAVDLRVGSPTFGRWEAVRLDDDGRGAVYLAEGLGHGFAALTEEATVIYLCSKSYAPAREWAVNPGDPELGINWQIPDAEQVLSARDAGAPTVAQARAAGLLPSYDACLAYEATLRR